MNYDSLKQLLLDQELTAYNPILASFDEAFDVAWNDMGFLASRFEGEDAVRMINQSWALKPKASDLESIKGYVSTWGYSPYPVEIEHALQVEEFFKGISFEAFREAFDKGSSNSEEFYTRHHGGKPGREVKVIKHTASLRKVCLRNKTMTFRKSQEAKFFDYAR